MTVTKPPAAALERSSRTMTVNNRMLLESNGFSSWMPTQMRTLASVSQQAHTQVDLVTRQMSGRACWRTINAP